MPTPPPLLLETNYFSNPENRAVRELVTLAFRNAQEMLVSQLEQSILEWLWRPGNYVGPRQIPSRFGHRASEITAPALEVHVRALLGEGSKPHVDHIWYEYVSYLAQRVGRPELRAWASPKPATSLA